MVSVRKAVRSAMSRLQAIGAATGTVDPGIESQITFWGGPMPDFVGIIRRQRAEH